jgi:hypothetical protein
MRSRNVPLAVASCALATVAAADSSHDIHFLAEHAPESGMDAHYAALPWPQGPLEPGWLASVDLSAAHTETDFIDLDGSMVAVAAVHGLAPQWGYEILGYASDMRVSGGAGRGVLPNSMVRGVPLDLPQPADFANPRGSLRHYGIGAALVRERRPGSRARPTEIVVGALVEHAALERFEFDYRLASGADAGVSGILDHSSDATFVTPFVGWQQTHPLGRRWTWSLRASLFWPLPPGDFDARLTGPGFDVSTRTQSGGTPVKIGDPLAALGLALAHRPSGLEVNFGALAYFPFAEHVSHPGVDRSWLLHFAWRRRLSSAAE